ncbi:MAG: asparagine synthetase B [Candidatus Firestonebacteria bacterium]|nr:asparagine synthetase B [Candidatus Firestonebacteria bacterium]
MLISFILIFTNRIHAGNGSKILIYMDESQTNHLKAYGVAYWIISQGQNVEWLLNYRNGSFLTDNSDAIQKKCSLNETSFEIIPAGSVQVIYNEIENNNMEKVLLEKAPLIAVYTPPDKEPWDDAVTLALTYADIPYDKIWDKEVLDGKLTKYDWLHLHHEDFTGQHGKFYSSFRNAPWYVQEVIRFRSMALELGYNRVQEYKCAVIKKIKEYVEKGGFLFAMCAATDTIDIALSSEGIDIVAPEIDGTPIDPQAQEKLDFSRTLAFTNFKIITNPFIYEFSDIDVSNYNTLENSHKEDFILFDFSAKYDPVPTMLTQNHQRRIKGFFGQTTSFNNKVVKDNVIVMGEIVDKTRSKYIHGNLGKGTFTFFGGHDPEDYSHKVGEGASNLSLHKHSPGYRLILNNILFPAAKKKKLKT